jgi:hypothetical protein
MQIFQIGSHRKGNTYLSVATLSLAMDIRSSWLPTLLPAPLTVVKGVLLPSVSSAVEDGSFLPEAAFFAAFSASLFCFEAEGGIVCRGSD